MHSRIVPLLIFPAYERLSGRRFWTEACRLRELQWRSPAELESRAAGRLQGILAHAGAHVPYYRELFSAAGVDPRAIRSVDDLARVPITTKAALRRRFPDGVIARNLPARRRLRRTTSGSTGLPLEFYLDRAAADAWIGSYLFFLEWAGTAFWHTEVVVASPRTFYEAGRHVGPAFARVLRLALGREQIWLGGPDTTISSLWHAVQRAARRRPYHLWAYASYAGRLARELLEGGRVLPVAPRAVIAASESLTPPERDAVREAFRAPVASHYSCLEIPRIAQTCPDNPAALHVNSERAIVRIVDDLGRTVPPGQRGRVAVTDLVNQVMPFINYDLGDTAIVGGPCDCGRGFPTLAAIEGRASETLVTGDGQAVSTTALGQFLINVCGIVPYVWEYQAVQETIKTVELRVVPTARYTTAVGETLRRQVETLFGSDTQVRVEPVQSIEREPSGKRLIIKSGLHGHRPPRDRAAAPGSRATSLGAPRP
jgi:phenylacetate-CoA ligase